MGLEPLPNTMQPSDLGLVPLLSELGWDGAGRGDALAPGRHHRSMAGKACSVPSRALAPKAAVCPFQFWRFQEATLTHLQAIASNYNLSYNIDARFQNLTQESKALALEVNQSQAAVQSDLGQLKTWLRKTQRRSRKVDSRLLALGYALRERSQQHIQERKEQGAQRQALSGLALDVRALQDTLAHLMHVVQSQGARLAALEGWLQEAYPGTTAPVWAPAQPRLPSPRSLKLQGVKQALSASPEPRDPPQDFAGRLQGTQEPPGTGSQWAWPPETQAESKYLGPALSLSTSVFSSHSSLSLWSPLKALSLGIYGEDTGFLPQVAHPRREGPSKSQPVCGSPRSH